MSSVEKRVRDGQTTWRAHYRTPAGAQRNKTFTRKGDADRFLATVESAKITGSFADPALARLTVGEWSTRWLEAQAQLKPSTLARYESVLRQHIIPVWGNVKLASVSHADIQTWVQKLAATRSASTARKSHRVLSLALALAVRDGRLARNPADAIKLPREVQKDRTYLTHVEVRQLAEACGNPATSVIKRRDERGSGSEEYRLVVLFLAYTGLRFGEMAALRVRRLNLAARRLEVAESVTAVNGVLVWGTPKGHARRWVSFPSFIAEQLAHHMTGKNGDDLVFTSPLGEPLRASNFRRDVFGPGAHAADLDGLVPHALRHTAASLAIASGADVKVVQQMLGHKSATMTLDLYGHLFESRLDDVASALDRAARDAGVARVLPERKIVDLEARRQALAAQQLSDLERVPPAGFEPATPALGVRRSIP
jgi:integrase